MKRDVIYSKTALHIAVCSKFDDYHGACTGVWGLMVPGMEENMFTVYIKSAGGTKKYFTEFDTEAKAEIFCREHGWEQLDENELV